jgi:hypothetical protein
MPVCMPTKNTRPQKATMRGPRLTMMVSIRTGSSPYTRRIYSTNASSPPWANLDVLLAGCPMVQVVDERIYEKGPRRVDLSMLGRGAST